MSDNTSTSELGITRRAVLGAVTAGSVGLAVCNSSGCDPGIKKSVEAPFQYGSQGTYEIEIKNHAPMFGICSGEIVVEDDLPPGISFHSVTGNWTASVTGGVVTATNDSYGSLDPGQSIILELTVTVASASDFPASPPIENCATATLDGNQVGTRSPDDNCVTHNLPQPEPTDTATDTPTDSPTATATSSPTDTPTATPRETPTDSPTDTPTATATSSPTATPRETPTDTPGQTPTATENEATSTRPDSDG